MVYIFLDESGDLGFDPKKINSNYFAITVLATHDKKIIEKIVKNIHGNLRKKVKRLSGGILHAYKEKPSTRKRLCGSWILSVGEYLENMSTKTNHIIP